MPLFAYSAFVGAKLTHGEVVASDELDARKLVSLSLRRLGDEITIRQVFEPPMRRLEAAPRVAPANPPRVHRVRDVDYRKNAK
jgi:hypothetical protein